MASFLPQRVSRQLSPPLLQSVGVACIAPLLAGYSIGYSSPALTSLRSAGVLSDNQGTVFASLLTFGGLVGAILGSPLLERYGRKPTLFVSQLFAFGGFILIACYASVGNLRLIHSSHCSWHSTKLRSYQFITYAYKFLNH